MQAAIPRPLRTVLWVLGALLALLLLIGSIGAVLWSRSARPRIEALTSSALGMDVSIKGRVRAHFAGILILTLYDVSVRNRDSQLLQAREVRLHLEPWPLLHHEVHLTAIHLLGVQLSLQQNRDGKFNFERDSAHQQAATGLEPTELSLRDAVVTYTNEQTGMSWRAGSCDLRDAHLRIAAEEAAPAASTASASADTAPHPRSALLANLALSAALECDQIQTQKLVFSKVRAKVSAAHGVFEFQPITLRAYQGEGAAQLRVDFTGAAPSYQAHYELKRFRIEDFWKGFSDKKLTTGLMDFTADLSAQGRGMRAITASSNGQASLRGTDLTLPIADFDKELSRYESTQRFDLIDAGAFLFAGPLGVLVTKGYDYARVLDRAPGNSPVSEFISTWQVEQGVAHAKDVALSTPANRLALTGALDFVQQQFQDVTVALVDKQGCVRVEQHIHGAFSQPALDKPNVVSTLAGPARSLVNQAKKVLGGKCQVFYAGSLAAPR